MAGNVPGDRRSATGTLSDQKQTGCWQKPQGCYGGRRRWWRRDAVVSSAGCRRVGRRERARMEESFHDSLGKRPRPGAVGDQSDSLRSGQVLRTQTSKLWRI